MFSDADQHNTHHVLFLPRVAAPLGLFIMTHARRLREPVAELEALALGHVDDGRPVRRA